MFCHKKMSEETKLNIHYSINELFLVPVRGQRTHGGKMGEVSFSQRDFLVMIPPSEQPRFSAIYIMSCKGEKSLNPMSGKKLF